ncbi:hypothetical protein L5515_006010 [Caenorhabditis briggsae]|uniref:Uncharacterized protein n=1 Tax=Caenorhabditis briggsae TaxID=6238 RepID=A0AAE9JKC2_CAEBR|nr:hypothetical protein L5515_006010 [Caenorhabditis briggsae]
MFLLDLQMARKNKKTKNKREAGTKMGKNNVKETPSKTTTKTVTPDRKQVGKVKNEAPKNVLNNSQRSKQEITYRNRNINNNQKPQNTLKTSKQNQDNKNVPKSQQNQNPPKKSGPSIQQNPVNRNGPSQNRKPVQSPAIPRKTPQSRVQAKQNGLQTEGISKSSPSLEGRAIQNLGDILKTSQSSHQTNTRIDQKEKFIKTITNNPKVGGLAFNTTTGEPMTTTISSSIGENLKKAAEEELNRMRYETQQSIAALLACIQLRLRFEEKEDEWSTSLKKLRQPLISLKTAYYDLQNEMKYFDPNDEFSNLQSECRFFSKKIEYAQNMLIVAFDNLDQMSLNFADRIFIRMIMKACSEQGAICHSIGVTLVEFLKSENPTFHMKVLDQVVNRLDPHSIPTTDMLKRNAPFAKDSEYVQIQKIPQPDAWLRYMN